MGFFNQNVGTLPFWKVALGVSVATVAMIWIGMYAYNKMSTPTE